MLIVVRVLKLVLEPIENFEVGNNDRSPRESKPPTHINNRERMNIQSMSLPFCNDNVLANILA